MHYFVTLCCVVSKIQRLASSESLVKSEFLYTLLAHIIAPISVNFESNRLKFDRTVCDIRLL